MPRYECRAASDGEYLPKRLEVTAWRASCVPGRRLRADLECGEGCAAVPSESASSIFCSHLSRGGVRKSIFPMIFDEDNAPVSRGLEVILENVP